MSSISDSQLHALTSTQKGFISSIRMLESQPNLLGVQLKERVAEMFPPAMLFGKELSDFPACYSSLRDFLDSRGGNLQQHSSRRIMMTLAHNLYEEGEDREAAIEIVTDIIAQGRRNRMASTRREDSVSLSHLSASPEEASSSPQAQANRAAHNVAMRLKDNEKKFSGELGESWMEFVDEYLQICRDYALSPTQKLQYLHNLLRGDAKRFYLDKVDGYATGFQQAVQIINDEYNSYVRQTRIKDYLNALRISVFMEKGLSASDSLSKVYKIIVKLSRQAPQAFRGDANKVEYLRNAVVGYHWAKEPLSRVGTMHLTFQQLHAELAASLQLETDTNRAMNKMKARNVNADETYHDINFMGQGRYRYRARRPQNFTRTNNPKQRPDPLKIQGCFNCDGNHLMRDCPKPIDTTRAATRKIEYYSKKHNTPHAVHTVLAELCAQLDTAHLPCNENEYNDHQVFQSIVNEQYQENEPEITDQDDIDDKLDNIVIEDTENDDLNTIYAVHSSYIITNSDETEFNGACVDSAAQRTVIGRKQALAYCSAYGIDPCFKKHDGYSPIFSFGTHRHKAEGYLDVRIPVHDSGFICIRASVVEVNVPLLLGLENMMHYKMVLDVDEKTLYSKLQGWKLDLRIKYGHLYLEWDVGTLFTKTELRKVHNHFYHPEPDRLYALFKRADPSSASPQLMSDLEKLNAVCDTCQREGYPPHRFRVSLPGDNTVFNRENCLDIMNIRGHHILHVVDRDTRFSAAAILHGESTKDVWRAYMDTWVTKYVGFPDIISVDQGPQFQSKEWKSLMHLAGITFKPSGVESHNAINVGERYHSFLRRIFNKIASSHEDLPPSHLLALSIRAMNDTSGTNGLVPTLLVFGVLPRIPILPSKLPDQVKRLQVMMNARKEMNAIVAKSALSRAMKTNVPSAAKKTFKIGDEVLVFREKPICKWVGPFKIITIDNKMAHLDYNGELKLYSIDKLKKYTVDPITVPPPPSNEGHNTPPDGNLDVVPDLLKELESVLSKSDSGNPPTSSLADELLGLIEKDAQVMMSKMIESNDPLANSSIFKEAKMKEVNTVVGIFIKFP